MFACAERVAKNRPTSTLTNFFTYIKFLIKSIFFFGGTNFLVAAVNDLCLYNLKASDHNIVTIVDKIVDQQTLIVHIVVLLGR